MWARKGVITGRAAKEAMAADFRALAEAPEPYRGCGVTFTEVDDVGDDAKTGYSPDPAYRYDEELDEFQLLRGEDDTAMATLDDAVTALKDWLTDEGQPLNSKVQVKITLPNQNDAARLIGRVQARRLERREGSNAEKASGHLPDGVVARRYGIEVEIGA